MGTLTINFKGICAWIGAPSIIETGGPLPIDEPAPLQWRVVLPQSNGFRYLYAAGGKLVPVPPHLASVDIGDYPIDSIQGGVHGMVQTSATTWTLGGVRMFVSNPSPQPMIPTPPKPGEPDAFDLVPSLTEYAGQGAQLQFSKNVVTGHSAAALFDIAVGTAVGKLYPDTKYDIAYVNYTVLTDGNPSLRVETFYDGSIATINFDQPNVTITIENTGLNMDTWWDWMIHYLCFTQMPPNAIPPGPNPPETGQVDGLTSGCSNSQFP